jgi:hypothetical protein
VDVRSKEQERSPRLPVALSDEPVPLRQATGRCHEQRPGKIRGRLRQNARRIADRTPRRAHCRDIDVVEADRVIADDAELRSSRIEELIVDLVGQQGQRPIDPGDAPKQLVPWRRQVAVPKVDLAGRPNEIEPLVGQPSRDEDPRSVSHDRDRRRTG